MILLEAAASRVATAAAVYGVQCSPQRSLRSSAHQIRLISERLAPLSLPSELRDFWTWWDPAHFGRPVFDGFLTSEESLACREGMIDIGFPAMLLPIAKYGKGMIWIEMQSPSHPGSRVYFGSYADPNLRLWAIGVSGLLEVLARALEDGGVVTWAVGEHRLDPAALESSLHHHHATAMDSPAAGWEIPIANEREWPDHWKMPSAN